jgi:hypothetical protein
LARAVWRGRAGAAEREPPGIVGAASDSAARWTARASGARATSGSVRCSAPGGGGTGTDFCDPQARPWWARAILRAATGRMGGDTGVNIPVSGRVMPTLGKDLWGLWAAPAHTGVENSRHANHCGSVTSTVPTRGILPCDLLTVARDVCSALVSGLTRGLRAIDGPSDFLRGGDYDDVLGDARGGRVCM